MASLFKKSVAAVMGLRAVWKSKFYGAFVLNHRVVLHAINASLARWRGDAGSSPLDGVSTATSSPRNDLVKNYRVHPTHWLISTQVGSIWYDGNPCNMHLLELGTSIRKSCQDAGMVGYLSLIHI